jgi:hypothetical protein
MAGYVIGALGVRKNELALKMKATTNKSAKKKSSKSKTPWEKPAPKKTRHTKLTAADKKKAKASAKKAGRPYPNLVDNMKVAKEKK